MSPRFYWYRKHLEILDMITTYISIRFLFKIHKRHTCDDGDVENGDFVIYDEDDLALFSHFALQYIRGVERTKKDVLKKKFSHAVERATSSNDSLLDVQDSTIEEKKKKVDIKKVSLIRYRVF
jgi:hypothetical protein